jgi:ribosomal protein S18 acetylase RimI-like enzyme
MIFSVCTLPDHRRQGLGSWILNRAIREARSKDRKGVVLTCKEEMIPFYERFGFMNEGLSDSAHGGAQWYQLRLVFDEDYDLLHQFDISDDPDENRRMFDMAFWGWGMEI